MTRIGLKWTEAVPEQTRTAVLDALDRFPASAVEIYWTHQRSTVGRVSIGDQCFVIKRYNAPKRSAKLRRMFGMSPAGRAWRNAAVMQRLGIATPRVIGIVTGWPWAGWRRGVCLVTEHLEGQASDTFLGSAHIPVERKRMVAARILQAVQRLHACGYVHGDLKARNILVCDDVPYFIDLDTLGRRRLTGRRGRAKDYARLIQTTPSLLEYAGSVPIEPCRQTVFCTPQSKEITALHDVCSGGPGFY